MKNLTLLDTLQLIIINLFITFFPNTFHFAKNIIKWHYFA